MAGKNDGHTTSGLDAALSAHADEIHPVDKYGAYPAGGTPKAPMRGKGSQYPDGLMPNGPEFSAYQDEASGYTKRGVIQRPYDSTKNRK